MIAKHFYVIRPKPELTQFVESFGIVDFVCRNELISLKVGDRNTKEVARCNLVLNIYWKFVLRDFLLEKRLSARQLAALNGLEVVKYFQIEEFKSCEEFEDLVEIVGANN